MSIVRGWFRRGANYRRPQPADMRHLALMDFLLEHYEEIPEQLLLSPPVKLIFRASIDISIAYPTLKGLNNLRSTSRS